MITKPCDSKPCQNGGTCVTDATSSTGYTCQCIPGMCDRRYVIHWVDVSVYFRYVWQTLRHPPGIHASVFHLCVRQILHCSNFSVFYMTDATMFTTYSAPWFTGHQCKWIPGTNTNVFQVYMSDTASFAGYQCQFIPGGVAIHRVPVQMHSQYVRFYIIPMLQESLCSKYIVIYFKHHLPGIFQVCKIILHNV